MKLTLSQIQDYHENGYLIIDDLFRPEEIEDLMAGLRRINNDPVPNIIREDNGDIRSVFAPQYFLSEFDWLYKQERLIVPSKQLLDDSEIYLYQYKLNNKKALSSGIWEWHQDFPFWNIDDDVKTPDMLSIMILLQDTDYPQGPLMFIPQSHKKGIAEFQLKVHYDGKETDLMSSLGNDLKCTVKNELIKEMVEKNGIVSGVGKVGTCIFFHPNLYHGSNANISPFDRNTAIITYNSISNLPTDRKEKNRPDYICSRNFEPIIPESNKLTNQLELVL